MSSLEVPPPPAATACGSDPANNAMIERVPAETSPPVPQDISLVTEGYKKQIANERFSHIKEKIEENRKKLADATVNVYSSSLDRRSLEIDDKSVNLLSKRNQRVTEESILCRIDDTEEITPFELRGRGKCAMWLSLLSPGIPWQKGNNYECRNMKILSRE